MKTLPPELIAQLETPCLVIDVETAKQNIAAMQRGADAAGVRLRPHIKTHKMPYFAKLQLAAGAAGITCAKVSEAEVMADAGIDDIFIAYPLVGAFRIRRALALARRLKRLILAVDSAEGAARLGAAAEEAGLVLEVRLEVDTGAARTGVLRDAAAELAVRVAATSGLRLGGIYTFKSLVYEDAPTTDNLAAGQEEGRMMAGIAGAIRAAGVPVEDVSAGSSPTGLAVAGTGLVNEIRPGTYIFKDYMLCREGVAAPEEIAGKVYATVVSTPAPHYAVLDGGVKAISSDVVPGVPPISAPGYALVDGRPDLLLARMNEEHGILTTTGGPTGLAVGQVLRLTPVHICTTVNLHNQVYLLENGALRQEKVAARGMLV